MIHKWMPGWAYESGMSYNDSKALIDDKGIYRPPTIWYHKYIFYGAAIWIVVMICFLIYGILIGVPGSLGGI